MAERRATAARRCATALVRSLVVAATVVAAVALAGGAEPRVHSIDIEGMQFRPAALTARRGDRVVWRNKDLVPHTATAAQRFDSQAIAAGGSWTTVVAVPGTLRYVCTFHPGMRGTLTVE